MNARDNEGTTALVFAALGGDAETVQALLDAGADVNAKNSDGWTALMQAASGGDAETVQALLDARADVNAKDNDGVTALIAHGIEWPRRHRKSLDKRTRPMSMRKTTVE